MRRTRLHGLIRAVQPRQPRLTYQAVGDGLARFSFLRVQDKTNPQTLTRSDAPDNVGRDLPATSAAPDSRDPRLQPPARLTAMADLLRAFHVNSAAAEADYLAFVAEVNMLTPQLAGGDNKFLKAVQAREPVNFPPYYFRQVATQDCNTVALEKELSPLLILEAVLELGADVHTALSDAETDPGEFFAAVDTAAYLATSCRKLVTARSGEIAAFLQYDAETAHKWAVQNYGSQITLMGDSLAAVALQLAKATAPKLAPRAAAAPWPNAASQRTQRAPSKGQGRGRTGAWGGRNTPHAEQRSGPGVGDAQAPAR